MTLAITDEQNDLRATVRRFVDRELSLDRVRELMATTEVFDRDLWVRFDTDLGILGLSIPEEYGGSGAGQQELGYVFEEFGRSLVPSPLLATHGLAVPALLASADVAAARRILPQIAVGSTVATVAWMAPGGDWVVLAPEVVGTQTADGWRLTGPTSYVLDGLSADVLLIVARTEDTVSLFAVTDDAAGVRRTALPPLDQTRPLAKIELTEAPATLIGEYGDGGRILSTALDYAGTLLAAEMVGGAQACVDMSVEYAKVREQFGRPIGSFQAIKHKCAEMYVAVEGARAAAYFAMWTATEDPTELPRVATVAKSMAAEAYFRAAADNVQIHGGIGFTWEHDAHLYFKRAKASMQLFGDVGAYRRRLADRIGL
ncbi:alkylation response protein AidB-like acyl-CoA dehydrogenase [Antricoccus suffuscus]|uniref:Alkylation response protein AidB-like acyl-CoA dehydrogenase n=1 Tax=Antricoccus suffuscus TaxID=1629062 RepID=A0A2T1A6Y7_9ACTN|nr:acyl-CoA dehydrogenase family protein [Antricoccus suffuscus]PRZ44237.1 alkylation response protein AidB-like acyl-CoA dehydrogenase [Antricoccus suffuscus]